MTTGPCTRWIDAWLETLKKTKREEEMKKQEQNTDDNEVEIEPEEPTVDMRKRFIDTVFEGFAQGSAAFVQEARLLSQDWGFKFEDITYDRVQLWHGTKDINSPVQMIRWMDKRLPHSHLQEFPLDTHSSLAKRIDEILAELVVDHSSRDLIPEA